VEEVSSSILEVDLPSTFADLMFALLDLPSTFADLMFALLPKEHSDNRHCNFGHGLKGTAIIH
jgi:hypothetical protein